MVKIDIISKELIKPSSPTPPHLRTYNLSCLDQLTPIMFFPLILYYSNDEPSAHSYSTMSHCLKTSLSDALTRFYPLAGRIKDNKTVDCNDGGVDYFEARVHAKLSDIIALPQLEVLNQLVPYKKNGSVVTRDEQLAIQVNLFDCGSIAIGVCISHKLADAHSLVMLINTWAAMASDLRDLAHPNLNAASLLPPVDMQITIHHAVEERNVTKRFVFNASAIAALKARAASGSCPVEQPRRVEVVTALIWKCVMAQRGLNKCSTSMAFHQVNIRGKIVASLPHLYFGNLIRPAFATSSDGEEELCSLVDKLREGIKSVDSESVRKLIEDNSEVVMSSARRKLGELLANGDVQMLRFSSWCRFPIYEADFGWGMPIWVSFASTAIKDSMFLMDSKGGDGVEAWVVLDEQDMAKFEKDSDLLSYVSSND